MTMHFSPFQNFSPFQILGMLALLGVLALAAWALARRRGALQRLPGCTRRPGGARMRVLGTLPLGPGQRLVQVQLRPAGDCGPGQRLLLGVGTQHITCLYVLPPAFAPMPQPHASSSLEP